LWITKPGCKIGIPIELLKFFEDKKKLKSGVNIANDGLKLRRDFGIVTNGLVELAHLAENAKSPKLEITHLRSLRALTGMFMEQHMPKGKVRLSNWAKPELTSQQIKYAATDAYVSAFVLVVRKEEANDVVLQASYQLFVILDDLRNTKIPLKIKHMIEDLGPIEKEEEKVIKKVSEKRHIVSLWRNF
jgi:ribonuclease D